MTEESVEPIWSKMTFGQKQHLVASWQRRINSLRAEMNALTKDTDMEQVLPVVDKITEAQRALAEFSSELQRGEANDLSRQDKKAKLTMLLTDVANAAFDAKEKWRLLLGERLENVPRVERLTKEIQRFSEAIEQLRQR